MDYDKIGAAITYLRKRAGFTQKELALRIGISDKAVSKWERGLTLPDVSCLTKLSILLDTDTDSLLAGDVIHHHTGWQGLLVLDENPYGIGAGTIVYDKPLVYFLLGYFMLVGIRDIHIFAGKADCSYLTQTFGTGERLGLRLHIGPCGGGGEIVFHEDQSVLTVFGRSVIYGVDQTRFFQRAMNMRDRLTVLALPRLGERSICFDEERKIVTQEDGEPIRTQYSYCELPIAFCPGAVVAGCRSPEQVKRAIAHYASEHDLYVQLLDRGYVEFTLDDWQDVASASAFVRLVQDSCGMNIYCPEEIAWRRGMISASQLLAAGQEKADTESGRYILQLCAAIEGEK